MCELVENYAKEVAAEAAKKAAIKAAKENEKSMVRKLLEMGVDFETVLCSTKNISVEELKEIYDSVKNS